MNKFVSTAKTPPNFWIYIEPTGFVYDRKMAFDVLMNDIFKHRTLYKLDLSEGWQARVEHEMTFYNECDWIDSDNPVPFEDKLKKYGRKMWKQLHQFASLYPEQPDLNDIQDARDWLTSWEARIAHRGCPCKDNWGEIRKIWNPDFSSRESLVNAFIDVHNLINLKLGKPIWNL